MLVLAQAADWFTMLERVGFPVFVAAGMCVLGYKVVTFFAPLVKTGFEKAYHFADTATELQKTNAASMIEITKGQAHVCQRVDEHGRRLDEHGRLLTEIHVRVHGE